MNKNNNNIKRNKTYRGFVTVLCLLAFLRLSCANAPNAVSEKTAPQGKKIIEARIISPVSGSSFSEGENIVFQWQQADVDVQGVDVYLDDIKINIKHKGMLPELPAGGHTLKLGLKEKMIDEVAFRVSEFSGYTLKFKPVGVDFPTCWPKHGVETTIIKKNDSDWSEFLPTVFDMSQEWKGLTGAWVSWQEENLGLYSEENLGLYSKRYGYKNLIIDETVFSIPSGEAPFIFCPPRDDNTITMNDVFVTFRIKNKQSLPKPIMVGFEHKTFWMVNSRFRTTTGSVGFKNKIENWSVLSQHPAGDHFIALGSELSKDERYRHIDFSRESVIVFSKRYLTTWHGGGEATIYTALVGAYEWNGKLYVIKKNMTKGSFIYVFVPNFLASMYDFAYTSILILDYAKDLPVEFITIP